MVLNCDALQRTWLTGKAGGASPGLHGKVGRHRGHGWHPGGRCTAATAAARRGFRTTEQI